MIYDVVKIFAPATFSFFVGLLIAPPLINYFYTHKMWKKKSGKEGLGGGGTPIFNELHKDKDSNTPRLGGVLIWLTVLLTTLGFWAAFQFFPDPTTEKLSFLSRNQTWLPFFTLIAAAFVGLIDDLFLIYGRGKKGGGLSLPTRIALVILIGLAGGLWFYAKLESSTLGIPFWGIVDFGVWIVPIFAIVMLALFSGGVIDGIDGLAGGIMSVIFAAYSIIAFFQNQIDLAAFCAVIAGATLAFLWFNIPPARFYMGESGMLGLTAALAVVAFLTDAVVDLLVIALPLFVASGSDIIQLLSKRFRGKKVFLVAPIHHHFEALGWPAYKVTMRFWIISVICAIIGTVLALLG